MDTKKAMMPLRWHHIVDKITVSDIIQTVIRFQILERTETAGGPEGPPLIFIGGVLK